MSDARQRAIYDKLGMKGVKAAWQLAATNKDSRTQDILEALQSADRWRKQSAYQVSIDSSIWFDPEVKPEEIGDAIDLLPSIRALAMQHAWEKTFGTTSCLLNVSVAKQYQMGAASANVVLRKDFGKLRSEFGLGLYGRRFVMLAVHQPTVFGQASLVIEVDESSTKHALTLSRPVTENCNAAISIGQSEDGGSISLELLHENPQKDTTRLKASSSSQGLALEAKKIYSLTDDNRLIVKLGLQRQQVRVSFGFQHDWSDEARSSIQLQTSTSEGVCLKLSLVKNDYQIVVPVLLSPEMNPSAILVGSILPALLGSLGYNLIYVPIKRYQQRLFWQQQTESQRHMLGRAKLQAEIALDILGQTHSSRLEASLLKIRSATFLSPNASLDVTVAVQHLVADNQLIIPADVSWAGLIGFYDIDLGSTKTLAIEYDFKGGKHRAEFADGTSVALPQRQHFVMPTAL